MSKASEILEGIKKLVFDKVQKFEEKKLQDGSPIMVSSLEVGGDVTINGTIATAGAYVLEDGTVLNVDESGKITEVKAPVATDGSVQMESHPLADGSSIDASALEVGGDVKIGDAPAPAGTYSLADGRTIVVGEDGKISEVKEKAVEASTQFSAEDLDTPEKLKAATEKFATGTPEERLANLEVVAKALMEYNFGWQIREAQNKLITDQAIATYKTNFEAAKVKIEKQDGVIKELVSLCEELAKAPQADPPSTGRKVNSFSKVETKNEKLNSYAEAARQIAEDNK